MHTCRPADSRTSTCRDVFTIGDELFVSASFQLRWMPTSRPGMDAVVCSATRERENAARNCCLKGAKSTIPSCLCNICTWWTNISGTIENEAECGRQEHRRTEPHISSHANSELRCREIHIKHRTHTSHVVLAACACECECACVRAWVRRCKDLHGSVECSSSHVVGGQGRVCCPQLQHRDAL